LTQSPTDDRTRLAIGVCLAYFGARLLALAVAIDPSVPPDETTHVGRVLAYATTWGIPAPGPENHALGLLGERPFLYYWVMARVHSLASLVFGDGLLPLRLANAALAFATAVCGLRFVRVVAPGQPLTHVVFLVLLTNTLMFTGVAASVSYDNGANLLGAAAFYHLARFCRDRDPRDLASLAIAAGLGCLAKRSFLPVAALLAVGLAWHERRRLRQLPARAAGAGGLRVAALALVAAANLWLYGGNLIEYGRLVPGFEQVVGAEAARQNRIFARDTLLDDFREGRLDLREAMRRTSEIDHPADRESARRQLAGLRRRGDFRLARARSCGPAGCR